MQVERLLSKLRDIRNGIRRTLETADEAAKADRCEPHPYKAGMFGAQLGIVAEQLEWIEREVIAERDSEVVELEDVA